MKRPLALSAVADNQTEALNAGDAEDAGENQSPRSLLLSFLRVRGERLGLGVLT